MVSSTRRLKRVRSGSLVMIVVLAVVTVSVTVAVVGRGGGGSMVRSKAMVAACWTRATK